MGVRLEVLAGSYNCRGRPTDRVGGAASPSPRWIPFWRFPAMELEGSGQGMLPDRPKRVAPSRSHRFRFRTAAETGSCLLSPSAHAALPDRRGESGPMFVSFAALDPVQWVLNRYGDRTSMSPPPAN